MLDDVAGFLACPQCGAGLARAGSALRCRAGHSFDIARQGYVSLLPPGARAPAGDSAPMVAARSGFLAAGHYGGLAARLAAAARAALAEAGTAAGAGVPAVLAGAGAGPAPAGVPGCVLDIGAGTGYYLAAVLDGLPGRAGLALDASKPALRRAARAHPRIGAVAADAWRRLPVADGAAAVVLDVFAPRQGAELARVLHPAGLLLVVTPNPGHLAELTGPLGLLSVDPRKEERLAATLGPGFALLGQDPHDAVLGLSHAEIAAVVGMGPSARHADPAVLAGRMAAASAARAGDAIGHAVGVRPVSRPARFGAGKRRDPGGGILAPRAPGATPGLTEGAPWDGPDRRRLAQGVQQRRRRRGQRGNRVRGRIQGGQRAGHRHARQPASGRPRAAFHAG